MEIGWRSGGHHAVIRCNQGPITVYPSHAVTKSVSTTSEKSHTWQQMSVSAVLNFPRFLRLAA